jgi:tetraacyldisaccharide 4'-kinase
VTKADGISKEEMAMMKKDIQKYAGDKPVFFSGLSYQEHLPINHSHAIGNKVLLVSAIAKNAQFERTASRKYEVVRHFRFADHHVYTLEDIQRIHQAADAAGVSSILTTEKDMVKLISPSLESHLASKNWFYIPVRAIFLENGMQFDELISRTIENAVQPREGENFESV